MSQSHQQDELLIQRYERTKSNFPAPVFVYVQLLEHICVQVHSHGLNQTTFRLI